MIEADGPLSNSADERAVLPTLIAVLLSIPKCEPVGQVRQSHHLISIASWSALPQKPGMASGTKDRIVEQATSIFNQLGYGNVTNAVLADRLGIRVGNLWYHFRDKRALLSAIAARFVERSKDRAKLHPTGGDVLDEYAEFLNVVAVDLRDYRFLFRDQADYGTHAPEIQENLQRLYKDARRQFRLYFKALEKEGHLHIDDDDVEPLVISAIIVVRYFLDFVRETQATERAGSGIIRQSLLQHLSLLKPYMPASSLTHLKNAIAG
ncbi:TetR/AcrR family transcriptional regulator [Altererythrobacter arenosus]|uniref:TetR/AcrR family transcriptional regulator n=1 Tax=Altererythrobacter arenosus TaxID=3032592 RepID=A0ABY8FU06_9SPHN|nr:TetR/AcrR family transcriptional regulator [Altererythrobacter sp. CAU 1644]WFL77570.1 TetR/AcrR family transcriptional regulator [Altererythrobacter sp. CAU 1644]